MKLHRLAAALGAMLVLVSTAFADESFVNGQKSATGANPHPAFIGGAAPDTTPWVLPIAAGGGSVIVTDSDRDREASTILSSGWADGDSLVVGVRKTCTMAVPTGDWNRLTVLVSWNTHVAADSDSVNIVIYPIGKVSTSMGDGQDYMIDLSSADTDLTPILITRNANAYTGIGNVRVVYAKTTTPLTGGSAAQTHFSSNAVAFNLATNFGNPVPVPLLGLAVVNIGGKALTNVNIDLWPRAW